MKMGVPIETALRWEQNYDYQVPEGRTLPPALREMVDHHFATARTKDWDARLKEYWNLHEYKIPISENHNDHKRTVISLADLNIDDATRPDTCSLSPSDQAEEGDLASYQLRSTVYMCKQIRRGEFHGFLQLPVEIRNMIYSHALHKGRVVVPNSGPATRRAEPVRHYRTNDGFYYRRYEGLETELLAMEDGRRAPRPLGLIQGVSRAVHDEAASIYFGGNQFIFPAGPFLRPRHCNLRGFHEVASQQNARFFHDFNNQTNNAPLLRDVSYTFDMRDHPADDYANLYRDFAIKDTVDSDAPAPARALQALHDQKSLDLEIDWAERVDSVKRMPLDRLVLDFQECYCAVGCHRKAGWVLDRLLHKGPPPGTEDTADNAYSSIGWVGRRPSVVEVMGMVSEAEEAMAGKKLRELGIAEVRFLTSFEVPDEIAYETHGDQHSSQGLFLH